MSFQFVSELENHVRKLMIKDYRIIEAEIRNQKANTDNTRELVTFFPTVSGTLDTEGVLFHHWKKNDKCEKCHNSPCNLLVLFSY